jgi:hypothetical protein
MQDGFLFMYMLGIEYMDHATSIERERNIYIYLQILLIIQFLNFAMFYCFVKNIPGSLS